MTRPLLEVTGLFKRFGGIVATDNVSLDVRHGELHAIIGPNGAGKTTLITQLTGQIMPDHGSIRFSGKDITYIRSYERCLSGLARSFQITSLFLEMTALDNVTLAIQAHDGHSFRFWKDMRSERALRDAALGALNLVGLRDRAEFLASAMSHGEHRLIELAMAIAGRPKLLLLDEPMAGLGPEESARMVDLLKKIKRDYAIMLVEHDMEAVFALADRVTVLVYGRVIATGTPNEIRSNSEVKKAYLGDEQMGGEY